MDAFIDRLITLGTVDGIMALLTLTVLEIVLGIDNLVFISVLVGKAPKKNQRMIRMVEMILAMVFRVILLHLDHRTQRGRFLHR
jgi:predicted tellurium resistance membrane protein TerC